MLADLQRAIEFASRHGRPFVTVSGHRYTVDDGKLIEVRCYDHELRDEGAP